MRLQRSFFLFILMFTLTTCSTPSKYRCKLKPGENTVALQEYKTTYGMNWPLGLADQEKIKRHVSADHLHLDIYTKEGMEDYEAVEKKFKELLPPLRHVKWYVDRHQSSGTLRIVVSDYKVILPLGPNWYAPEGNKPHYDHGRATAHNLGVMLDDPYELKTTDHLGPVPASTLGITPREKIKIDVETS